MYPRYRLTLVDRLVAVHMALQVPSLYTLNGPPIEKDADILNKVSLEPFGKDPLINVLQVLQIANNTLTEPVSEANVVQSYINLVNDLPIAKRKQQELTIKHFRSTPMPSTASLAKNFIRKILLHDYKSSYPGMNWAYTNFNCLNFFTGSLNYAHGYNDAALAGNSPTNGTALIYPAPTSSQIPIIASSWTSGNEATIKAGLLLYTPYRPRKGFYIRVLDQSAI